MKLWAKLCQLFRRKSLSKQPRGDGPQSSSDPLSDHQFLQVDSTWISEFGEDLSASLEPGAAGNGGAGKSPQRYGDYQPVVYKPAPAEHLSVHYWFYVYLQSSDCDRLLAPFVEQSRVDRLPLDRRLMCLMNRWQVQVRLSSIELYKALPRYILAVRGANWRSIVQAVLHLEETFPELMRFASHPLLMDTSTCRFASVCASVTAPQTRITRCH